MKKYLAGLVAGILLVLGSGVTAHASLVVTGTVDYMGAARNLIYDTDLNITWLDYSAPADVWAAHMAWAANLSVFFDGYHVTGWRLPSTVDGPDEPSNDGTTSVGTNNPNTSEMSHLYYTELGNKGNYDIYGNYQSGYGLTNTGAFANLLSSLYDSGTWATVWPNGPWNFNMSNGGQGIDMPYLDGPYALAVHPGLVGVAPVPEPASMLLIGSGFAGLVGLKRRKK